MTSDVNFDIIITENGKIFCKEIIIMKSVKISLSSIEAVRNFVEIVRKFNEEIDLSSGRYVVDAKSIMGIFSLDLLNPITLTVHSDDCDKIFDALKDFIIE